MRVIFYKHQLSVAHYHYVGFQIAFVSIPMDLHLSTGKFLRTLVNTDLFYVPYFPTYTYPQTHIQRAPVVYGQTHRPYRGQCGLCKRCPPFSFPTTFQSTAPFQAIATSAADPLFLFHAFTENIFVRTSIPTAIQKYSFLPRPSSATQRIKHEHQKDTNTHSGQGSSTNFFNHTGFNFHI